MFITHTIALLPLRAQKQVLKTLVASMNQSVIKHARAHIREEKRASRAEVLTSDRLNNERALELGVPTFDQFNEIEVQKIAKGEGDSFLENSGGVIPEEPLVSCIRATALRNFLVARLENTEDYNDVYDAAFGVANSLAFNIERMPNPDLDAIKRQAEATGIAYERLVSAGAMDAARGRDALIKDRDRILGIYEQCSMGEDTIGKSVTPISAEDMSEGIDTWIENLIQELPAPDQFKLGVKVDEIIVRAASDAVTLMMRPRQRGSNTAASDVVLIDSARAQHFKQLSTFEKKNASALDAYADQAWLPMMPDEVEEQVAATIRATVVKEETAKVEAAEKGAAFRAKQLGIAEREPVKADTAFEKAIAKFNNRNVKSI